MCPQTIPADSRADPVAQLEAALRRAFADVLGPEHADADPLLRPSQNREFGDYQANGAMGLAKKAGENPRDLAQRVVAAADVEAIAEPLEVAGPGFINIRLRAEAIERALTGMDESDLGVDPDPDTHAVAIDMCAVNVAKQMHVGHLRSTIIGDALARAFERRGRTVYRENHLGDWGLPIAMVLTQLRASGVDLAGIELTDLDRAYRDAQLTARADQRGLEAARTLGAGPHRIVELEAQNESAETALAEAKAALVKLQQGDDDLRRDWQRMIECTLGALDEAIAILNVKLGRENNRGESFYNDRLAGVVESFLDAGLAEERDGAIVVPFEGRDKPMVIRKSEGGFLYATTDLAAVRFRVQELHADRVIYVVDARQRDHFRDVFDAVRAIGWDRDPDGTPATLTHIPFGAVLGGDRKPLKTRAGDNVTLRSLLDEACARGAAEVRTRADDPKAPTHGLDDDAIDAIGRAVGIAAIKYADLSSDLVRDYIFDMDRMIAFEGNTGPYLQYAHARICQIFTKADLDHDDPAVRRAAFKVTEPAEKDLALLLLRYGSTVADVTQSLEPHRLCTYLWDLANAYSSFYQTCPVLKAPDDATRDARLRLCDVVRRVMVDGLDLLGIEAPERM